MSSQLIDHGGPVIQRVVVQPIFWGKVWNDPLNQLLANQIVASLRELLAGPYMRGLIQYRGISPGWVLDPVPAKSEPPDPMTPAALSGSVDALIADNPALGVKPDDGRLFMAFTRGVTTPGGAGFHDIGNSNGVIIPVAWVQTGSLDETIARASHELIEACTNPFPGATKGFLDATGQEVADLCSPQQGLCEGVTASYYWSNADAACVLPRRTFVITIDPDECKIGPVMNGISHLRAAFAVLPPWLDTSNLRALDDPAYEWNYDDNYVTPQGPAGANSILVKWALPGGPLYETTVTYSATYGNGLTLRGSIAVRPLPPWKADLLYKICQLRSFLASENRRPQLILHKLGPDPAPFPAAHEIKELEEYGRYVAREIEQISALAAKANRENVATSQ